MAEALGSITLSISEIVHEYGISEDYGNRVCSRDVLNKIALLMGDWKNVGALLNFNLDEIKAIEEEFDVSFRKTALLGKWQQREGKRATYFRLIQVFRSLKREDIIEKICDLLKDQQRPIPPTQPGHSSGNPPSVAEHDKEIPKYQAIKKNKFAEEMPEDKSNIYSFANEVQIIIQTVNDNETLAVLSIMKPPYENFSLPVNFKPIPYKHMLGMFGGYKSVLVKTDMGDECDREIAEAIKEFPNVQAILAVGVAWANNENKECRYGDVLVSKYIHGAKNMAITDERVDLRPSSISTVKVDELLTKTFTAVPGDWKEFECNKDGDQKRFAVVYSGEMISLSILIKSQGFRTKVLKNYPQSIGGEMEAGCILKFKTTFEEHAKKKVRIIIIKGVSDFADGEKFKGDIWQYTAAKAAASYTDHKLKMTKGKLFCVTE